MNLIDIILSITSPILVCSTSLLFYIVFNHLRNHRIANTLHKQLDIYRQEQLEIRFQNIHDDLETLAERTKVRS